MSSPTAASRVSGCLVGTLVAEAVALAGDAGLPDGIPGPTPPSPPGPAGQLSLYTADALLEAIEWANDGVHADEAACVWLASLRWLAVQGVSAAESSPVPQPRWLDRQDALTVPAAYVPGWAASLADGEMGTTARPVGLGFDDAGAAAHAAPFGLVPHVPAAAVAKMSVDGASLTHGAPAAVQAASAVACMAHYLVLGADARTAAASSRAQLAGLRFPDADVLGALDAALGSAAAEAPSGSSADDGGAAATLHAAVSAVLAAEDAAQAAADGGSPGAEDAEAEGASRRLGALRSAFAAGVRLAGPAGADAAAITGALLGVRWGRECIPGEWAEKSAGVAAADGLAAHFAAATGL